MKHSYPLAHRDAVLAIVTFVTAAAVAQGVPDPLVRGMTNVVAREHGAGRFDGVVLVGRGDAAVYRHAIGFSDREKRQLHRVDEPWRLASVSKQFAALLVMRQVESGALTLDTRLDTLIPDFKSPLAAQITVQHLLQHTSGLPNPDATVPDDAVPGAMPSYYKAVLPDETGPVDAALAYCSGPPAGEPGARFSYNNIHTLMVQAMLERLTGQPYTALLKSAIAVPLQLKATGMADGLRERATPAGYIDERREPSFNLLTFGASGALIGSADDLWQVDRALMQYRLLGEAATRAMWAGDPKLGYVALGAWSFPARLPGCDKSVALVERRGEIGGVQVRNLLAPEFGAALIVLSNTSQTEFGEIWQGRGLLHEMAGLAFCQRSQSG